MVLYYTNIDAQHKLHCFFIKSSVIIIIYIIIYYQHDIRMFIFSFPLHIKIKKNTTLYGILYRKKRTKRLLLIYCINLKDYMGKFQHN